MRPGTLAPAAGVQFGGEEVAADLGELCASFCSIEHCDQPPIRFASAVGTRLLVCKLERRSESHREAATNGCPRNSHTHLTQIAFEAEEIQSLYSTSPGPAVLSPGDSAPTLHPALGGESCERLCSARRCQTISVTPHLSNAVALGVLIHALGLVAAMSSAGGAAGVADYFSASPAPPSCAAARSTITSFV